MRKRRIAFIIGSLSSGGAERVVSTLSNELINNFQISIITLNEVKPFYPLDARIKLLACSQKINPSNNILEAFKTNYVLIKRIIYFLKSEKIELCIGFLTTSNILSIIACKTIKIPVIVSERIDPKSSKKSFVWEKLRRISYPMANYIVIQTENIRDFFSPWIDKKKLQILPNPLSPNLIYSSTTDESRENIILNVGRLTDQKGQESLIKIFAELNPENWKLIIVGEGINRPIYERLIKKMEMQNKILLMGSQKNISKFYSSAKIFAFTSKFEGFPNALIEAMHMGLPCISTNCPTGPSELIVDDFNGFLVNLDDNYTYKKKLEKLIKDKILRNKFSKNGKITVERFSTKAVVHEWEILINSAINK